jgi:hypothetical protein
MHNLRAIPKPCQKDLRLSRRGNNGTGRNCRGLFQRITPAITKALMSIEADRQAVSDLPIDVAVLGDFDLASKLI